MKKLDHKIIITKMVPPGGEKEAIVTACIEENRLAEVHFSFTDKKSTLKNIYVGKVQKVVKNIQAAFIEYEKGMVGYYSLDELQSAIFTNKKGSKPIVAGDELLVQVQKEPMKTKAAVLTTNLNIIGTNFVLTTGKPGIGLSGKLTNEQKTKLKELVVSLGDKEFGIIIRTNAAQQSSDMLLDELDQLEKTLYSILKKAPYQTAFSLLYEELPDYLRVVENTYYKNETKIITDNPDIAKKIPAALFYEDDLLPLKKLYNLENQIEKALNPHVWLKSGGYLLIEPTEAFTSIDVNTGKCITGKKKEETFFKLNLEAAKEIAMQLRLRNISGIILVDFVNLESQEHIDELLSQFSKMVQNDHMKTVVVDMTPLGIVEVTRQKERPCLQECLKQFS